MTNTIQQKHDLIRAYEKNEIEKEEYESKIVELIEKEKLELKERMKKIEERIEVKKHEIESMPKKVDKKYIRNLYKESIKLYRDAEEIFLETRKIKKNVRDLM